MSQVHCPACNAPAGPTDKNCPACGLSLEQGAPAPSIACAGEETVLGAIGGATLKQGLFRHPTFSLVVTSERIIAARVTNDMLRQAAKDANDGAKASGKGLARRWLATMGSGLTFHNRYLDLPPEQTLHEHESNFAFAADDVRSVKSHTHHAVEEGRQLPDELVFKLNTGAKHRFRLRPNCAADAAKVLRPLLGKRVK
jgi:hypothetical protein